MPSYDYQCQDCGVFTLTRSLADRNQPANCPTCQQPALRVLSAPNLSLMPGARRDAFARNEKSSHEPGVQKRHRCGSGCGCGSPKNTQPDARKRKVNLGKAGVFETPSRRKRPWMLGN